MIAKISPLIRLPSKTDVFDYHVPDELKNKIAQGHLVTIPWRTQKVAGVVLSLSEKVEPTKFRARPITNILEENPVLTTDQLKLINQFAEYYFVTPGAVARLITPDKPKRIVKAKSRNSELETRNFSISKKQLPKLQEIKSKLSDKINYLQIQDVSSFVWLIIHLTKQNPDKQILVLFPTIDLIKTVSLIVQKMCSGNMAVIYSQLSKGEYWNEYQKIVSNKAKIILSTRQGAFLPIQGNSKIIFFESTSQDFKQYEQHPKYDARIVAAWIANITKSQLIYTSSSGELFNSDINKSVLPSALQIKTSVKLIDMKTEMQKKDFSIIADSTLNSIKETIANNQKVLIISLRQDSEEGVSAHKIQEVLTNTLKNCRVAINNPENDLKDNFDILVSTSYSLETLKLNSKKKEFGLAVFSSIEPLLALPDFRSAQRTFNKLNYWKMMCNELQIPQIILQSYSPDNLSIRAFAYGEVDTFKKSELENRKQILYPPFVDLIKLSYKGDVTNEIERAIKSLKENLNKDTQVLGPFKDKKENQSLLLKIPHQENLSIINSLPFGWMIDRDPENVL